MYIHTWESHERSAPRSTIGYIYVYTYLGEPREVGATVDHRLVDLEEDTCKGM